MNRLCFSDHLTRGWFRGSSTGIRGRQPEWRLANASAKGTPVAQIETSSKDETDCAGVAVRFRTVGQLAACPLAVRRSVASKRAALPMRGWPKTLPGQRAETGELVGLARGRSIPAGVRSVDYGALTPCRCDRPQCRGEGD